MQSKSGHAYYCGEAWAPCDLRTWTSMLSAHSRDLRRTKEKEHPPQSTTAQSDGTVWRAWKGKLMRAVGKRITSSRPVCDIQWLQNQNHKEASIYLESTLRSAESSQNPDITWKTYQMPEHHSNVENVS